MGCVGLRGIGVFVSICVFMVFGICGCFIII